MIVATAGGFLVALSGPPKCARVSGAVLYVAWQPVVRVGRVSLRCGVCLCRYRAAAFPSLRGDPVVSRLRLVRAALSPLRLLLPASVLVSHSSSVSVVSDWSASSWSLPSWSFVFFSARLVAPCTCFPSRVWGSPGFGLCPPRPLSPPQARCPFSSVWWVGSRILCVPPTMSTLGLR